ncbi:MAG: helix-turn-helix domain-containing protein [Pseudomonadota bacterium]
MASYDLINNWSVILRFFRPAKLASCSPVFKRRWTDNRERIAAQSHSGRDGSPIAVAPAEAARLANVGRTKIYEAIGSGELPSLKIGRRRLIRVEALREWLLNAERATQEAGNHAG